MARPAARAVRHPPSVGLDRIPTSCRDVPLNVGKTTPPIWPFVVFRLLCLALALHPIYDTTSRYFGLSVFSALQLISPNLTQELYPIAAHSFGLDGVRRS
ncbi:uncharacterized protein DEA37_0002165 [Paragonimus westermani]|uniref:Uncharacterized protein n=1 Tax=Paragonimus westermani TaxID=34504 RepID=A0A5J4P0L8_9TREM|nr:uncharacterized protein DEA37_0002165 [Paragonimus westermani]